MCTIYWLITLNFLLQVLFMLQEPSTLLWYLYYSKSRLLDILYVDVQGSISCSFNEWIFFLCHFSGLLYKICISISYVKKIISVSIFSKFKIIAEKCFKTFITKIYFDGGGKYYGLKFLLKSHGIQCLYSPAHTP